MLLLHLALMHAPVRGVDVTADEGDAHAWLGLHAKHLQHKQMAVSASKQHQILYTRYARCPVSHAAASTLWTGTGVARSMAPWTIVLRRVRTLGLEVVSDVGNTMPPTDQDAGVVEALRLCRCAVRRI